MLQLLNRYKERSEQLLAIYEDAKGCVWGTTRLRRMRAPVCVCSRMRGGLARW